MLRYWFCKEFQDLPQPKKDIQATPGAATDCKQTHNGEQEVNAHLGMMISCGIVFLITLQGTKISPPDKAYLKMMFLFPRWDILLSWRVVFFIQSPKFSFEMMFGERFQ